METFDPVGGGFLVERITNFFSGGGTNGGDALVAIYSILAVFEVIFIFFLVLFMAGIVYVIYQLRVFRPRYKLVYDSGNLPQQRVAQKRWAEIMARFQMGTESDWRLSVIEADSLADDVFKRIGFQGENLGERIASISSQELNSLADLREAHQMRNRLVHTPGYKLSQEDAQRALRRYQKVLEELEVI